MSNVKWNDSKVREAVKKAKLKAGVKAGEDILTAAIPETPKRPPPLGGTLRASGTVNLDEANEEVRISFNTPYAAKQHEEMSYRHTVGKAKYLEDPFRRKKKTSVRYIQLKVNEALKNGGRS